MLAGPTTIELLNDRVRALAAKLDELTRLSRLNRTNWNDRPNSGVTFFFPPYWWEPLPPAGVTLQAEIHEAYQQFLTFAAVILSRAVPTLKEKFDECTGKVQLLIEQSRSAGLWSDLRKVSREAGNGLQMQLQIIASLAKPPTRPIVVPDTCALLAAPNLSAHDYAMPAVELAIVPVVLRQLDRIKDDMRREPSVRQSARTVIREVQACRDKGDLLRGVPLNSGVTLRAVATEPKVADSLPWLDPDTEDDQLIASVLEIVRNHLGERVVLATVDINLGNKAALALIPCTSLPGSTA